MEKILELISKTLALEIGKQAPLAIAIFVGLMFSSIICAFCFIFFGSAGWLVFFSAIFMYFISR